MDRSTLKQSLYLIDEATDKIWAAAVFNHNAYCLLKNIRYHLTGEHEMCKYYRWRIEEIVER